MTRHQRRKRARAKALRMARQEMVRNNLSQERIEDRSAYGLVSHVYHGAAMDRARGFGAVPMTRPRGGYRVISVAPGPTSWEPARD